jgi:AraC-like DNA-binding protein
VEVEKEDTELDLLPENCHYRDEGCEVADAFLGHKSSCLNCPFPHCIYDEPGGEQRWRKRLRNAQVLKLAGEGMPVKELAVRFGVSRRTVQRILKGGEETDG